MRVKKSPLIVAAAAIAAIAMVPVTAAADEYINILTGGQSGVYYPLGVAIESLVAENMPDATPSTQATKASVENLNLLQDGKGELAFTLGDSLALARSEEHTSELQSLMRISYAVFCLTKKQTHTHQS